MEDPIKKLNENQAKIVAKIQEMDSKIMSLEMINNQLVQENKSMRDRIGGLETIICDMGVKKEALELHQSFNDDEMKRKIKEGL